MRFVVLYYLMSDYDWNFSQEKSCNIISTLNIVSCVQFLASLPNGEVKKTFLRYVLCIMGIMLHSWHLFTSLYARYCNILIDKYYCYALMKGIFFLFSLHIIHHFGRKDNKLVEYV